MAVRKARGAAWAAALALAFTGAVAAPSSARSGSPTPGEPRTIAEGFAGPTGLAVANTGTVYVADLFAGTLFKVRRGVTTPIASAQAEGQSITGVVAERHGVAYTETGGGMGTTIGFLRHLSGSGRITTLGDTGTFEATQNPDQVNTYGFQDLSEECLAQIPPDFFPPPQYTGALDSNSYAVVTLADGSRVVADAGGNDLVRIRKNGRISTLAVLPPIPVTVPDDPSVLGLPDCTAGATYGLEPVPTDVEIGPHGHLYVTALPGGPEDGSLGANGAVFKVNPRTGKVTLVATGFAGATDLAIGPGGTIYVTELFGNRISVVKNGGPRPFLDIPAPNAVEYKHGALYAAVGFGSGNASVVKIPLRHHGS